MDSAVAGESEAGDGGNEVGKRQPFEQVCWREENSREPLKGARHGDEGGSD